MFVEHSGITYECASAVKCEDDKYIKLFDENGAEIASFHNISDFTEYTASGGSFVAPCDCNKPILLTAYSLPGVTISAEEWIPTESGDAFYYDIENDIFSGNATTCNVLIFFADGTEFEYSKTQSNGKITLTTAAAPLADVVIESIQIIRT